LDDYTVVRILTWRSATNGIVLATEKKSSSPLIDPPSLSKVSLVTPNIGMVYAGMGPDYRVLVDRARKVSHTGYKRIYNEYPPTRILVQDVARVMQEATQSGGVRPYGVSLLIAGWDEGIEPQDESKPATGADAPPEEKKASGKTGGILKGGPMLYQVDPSGSYFPWKATAIGKSATSAKVRRYSDIPQKNVAKYSLDLLGEEIHRGFGVGRCHPDCSVDTEGDY
jgi:20S proteasome subunit alpha 2